MAIQQVDLYAAAHATQSNQCDLEIVNVSPLIGAYAVVACAFFTLGLFAWVVWG